MARVSSSSKVAQSGDDPHRSMMLAYRALRYTHNLPVSLREEHMEVLLAGRSGAWAWFALKDLELSEIERRRLCKTVVSDGDGLIMVWVLRDISGLPQDVRNTLFDAIVSLRLGYIAIMVLEQFADELSLGRRRYLERISAGLDPDE